MGIYHVSKIELIDESHLISAFENWDLITETAHKAFKLFGKGGVIDSSKENMLFKKYFSLLKVNLSPAVSNTDNDEISYSTFLIPCWDLFKDEKEAVRMDGILYNLLQNYNPNKEFYYAKIDPQLDTEKLSKFESGSQLLGENEIGSNIFIYKLPLEKNKLEKIGIKVLSDIINKQADLKTSKKYHPLIENKKFIEFWK